MITLTPHAVDALVKVPSQAPAPGKPFNWQCWVCRRRVEFGYEELKQFARGGWPVCCGEVVIGGKNRVLGLEGHG